MDTVRLHRHNSCCGIGRGALYGAGGENSSSFEQLDIIWRPKTSADRVGASDAGPYVQGKSQVKALGRGGVINGPLFLDRMGRGDPTFQSIEQNVFCNISATTIPNLDFNGAFEPPDP